MPEGDALHLLAQDVAVLKRDYSGLHQDVSGLGKKIDALTAQVSAQQRTNWPLILSIGTVLLAVIGGGWKVVDLQNQLTVAKELAPLVQQNAQSTEDRQELAARVDRLAQSVSGANASLAGLQAGVVEIETQFRGAGEIINLITARFQTDIARLWTKTYGEPYPDVDYAPQIGRSLPPAGSGRG